MKRLLTILGMLLLLPIAFFSSLSLASAHHAPVPKPHLTSATSVTVYLQVMDSCKEGLPGATFTLVAPDQSTQQLGPSAGTKRLKVADSSTCPLQRGNCASPTGGNTGCITVTLPIPTSGPASYTVNENATFVPGDGATGLNENPPSAPGSPNSGFMVCQGGSACKSEVGAFTISTAGVVTGSVTNVYPDGYTVTWPTSGPLYQGTISDPIVFHNFQVGLIRCESSTKEPTPDNDDFLTGGVGSHCDNDKGDPTS